VKILYIFLVLACLAGCATVTQLGLGEHKLSWPARQKQLNNLKNWNLHSAIGIKNLNQRTAAHVHWQQFENNYILNITSQFNIGGVKIVGDSTGVTLWRSATNKISAQTPEELMYQELGWALPIDNLRYWILGLPAPKLVCTSQFDAYNHLIYLQQQGWQISYSNFISINNIDLPTAILINNSKLQIKVVIKKWEQKGDISKLV
jgi:outer membrane lipoprotein LolB